MEDRRIVVALDGMTASEALRLVERLGAAVATYKIGLELFTRHGPNLVDQVRRAGKEVFLDLKFHDIPATVGRAVDAAADLGPSYLTLHASGGSKMIDAAVEARRDRPVRLLAVTVLTSAEGAGTAARVEELATLARRHGADGVVASAREARRLKEIGGTGFLVATPGIRPAGAARDDQARVATPAEAIAAGADLLVVGRPITKADDPAAALGRILEEIRRAE